MATVLSVESQGKSIFTAALAPILGYLVDLSSSINPDYKYLPIASFGLLICLIFRIMSTRSLAGSQSQTSEAPSEATASK